MTCVCVFAHMNGEFRNTRNGIIYELETSPRDGIYQGSFVSIMNVRDLIFVLYGIQVQWNLSVTTTFIIKFITCDLFSNVFKWRLKVPIYSC